MSENNDEDNDDADTYFHNGLDSYLHAITRPNKLLRISENGDITYSIRQVQTLSNITIRIRMMGVGYLNS